jgi:L,D-transpeptidase catalytic domain
VARTHACCGLLRTVVFLWGLCCVVRAGQTITCHLEAVKSLSRFNSDQLALLVKLNHADAAHLTRFTRILVPDRWDPDELLYSPMPRDVPELSQERKAIVVDLAAQVFGAYENGHLVRWGPVSTGDRRHQTPSGVYHLNWHQRVRVSSDNPTWIMPWYFNFESEHGFGLHEYALPGRPASHGCARLLTADAQWLFHWGEGWTLADDTRQPLQPGTLVVLLGKYDFGAPQPWLRPKWWARGVSLPLQQIATRR